MPIDEERRGVERSLALTLGGINDGRRQGRCAVSARALWLCRVAVSRSQQLRARMCTPALVQAGDLMPIAAVIAITHAYD
jgi:hypothetical protein